MKTLLAAVVLVSTAAQAATLKELLDAADKNNVDRRISAEQRSRASAEAIQAWTTLLPTITAQGVWQHNQYQASLEQTITYVDEMANVVRPVPGDDGRPRKVFALIQGYQQFNALLRVDIPLLDVSRWYRVAAADAAQGAAIEREDVTRDVVRRQVVGAWFGYAAALAVRESANRSAKVAEAQAKLQEVRASAGAATELERLRAEAEVQRNRQVVADSESLVATSRRTLRTLTGIEPGDVAALPADNMAQEAPFEELEKNVDQLPAVKAARRDVTAANRNANAARLTLVPTIGGQFTETASNVAGFTGQNTAWNGGATITWRLDGSTIAGFNVQSALENTAELAVERAQLAGRDQIHSDWQRLNAALHKLEAAKAQLQAAERAAQVARDRYAAGAATQIDVIQAERDLFGAEVGQIQARTELASARLSLRISAAQPLQVE